MDVSKLVEAVFKTVAKDASPEKAMRGFLKGTEDAAEKLDPGNQYSKELRRAINLLDRGVLPGKVAQALRESRQ